MKYLTSHVSFAAPLVSNCMGCSRVFRHTTHFILRLFMTRSVTKALISKIGKTIMVFIV
jgi:hypothetical protein